MAEAKDTDGYPTAPRKVNSAQWFYEQKSGLDVYPGVSGGHINIPWRKLCAAVDRHRRITKRNKYGAR